MSKSRAEIVEEHILSLEGALKLLRERVNHRAVDLPTKHDIEMRDLYYLIREHLEGFEFEYELLIDEERAGRY